MTKVSSEVRPLRWIGDWATGYLEMLDQRGLPEEVVWEKMTTVTEVAEGIRAMKIRGAPAIGIAAAFGVALGIREHGQPSEEMFTLLAGTRPTAVNLFWALDRMRGLGGDVSFERAFVEAQAIFDEDSANNLRLAEAGVPLFGDEVRILTHCNTGGLATGQYGTALGVIRALSAHGKLAGVWVDETRPYLQGARLTTWELMTDGIDCTLITDNMAAHFMQRGEVDAVIVGTDRVAANGDVANKIGTYGLAVLCHHHNIPFYVAAPISTIDLATPDGDEIVIEQRSVTEVTEVKGQSIAPAGVSVAHPAFDVTPAALVTAIITEAGVVRAPYPEGLAFVAQTSNVG